MGDGTAGHDSSIPGNILNNAALVYNLNGNQTYAGVINGSGALTKAGSGTLTLVAHSTYGGPTVIAGGTINFPPPIISTANINIGGNNGDTNPGSYSVAGGAMTITGAGDDFWGGTEQGYYVYKSVATSDNFDVAVHIASLSGGDGTWAKAGIMARQDASNNNVNTVFDAETTGSGVNLQWTNATQNNGAGGGAPNWLRLAYNAATDTFTGYESPSTSATAPTASDSSWQQIASYQVPITGSTFLLGIADTAHDNLATNTAVFDNLGNIFTNANLLPATTPLSIANGAMLDLSGFNQQVASLSDYAPGSGGSIINSNTGSVSVLTLSPTGGSTTFSGMIEGSGTLGTIDLVMSGSGTQVLAGSFVGPGSLNVNSGTLILSGSNSYTGGTTVLAGTLVATTADAIPSGTGLTVGAGGASIFAASQADAPVAGSAVATSSVAAVPEPGTLVLLAAALVLAALAARRRR